MASERAPLKRKRVLVLGAGAAGMSCAEALSQHPEQFDVTVIEAQGYVGGQAFSIPIDEEKHGASWLNQGVQGGSYIYHHTFRMMAKQGYQTEPVDLQVSFGKGESFWSNLFPSPLLEKHGGEIRRFSRVIKFMRWFELVFALIPIKVSLKMFFFSDDFMNYMIYPSLALFLGTGNATPDLPTVMMERLFTSPTYGMWYPVDPVSLVSNLPPMVVFPESTKFYTSWKDNLTSQGVKFRLNTEVVAIPYRGSRGVTVHTRPRREEQDGHNAAGKDQDLGVALETYNEIVLCVLADTAKRLLGRGASWREKTILGATKWSDDITVTHTDLEYMEKQYTLRMPNGMPSELSGQDQSIRLAKGQKEFLPMYLIAQTSEPKKLEMCFDCSAFQYQLARQNKPLKDHVFQTIFLNKKDKETWSMSEIREDKIIRRDWWHQLEHRWTHYAFVVPFMWLLNGSKKTRYAGSWTLVNAHELAVISGMAAAYSLGASYPKDLEEDSFALLCFRLYLLLDHGKIFWKSENAKRLERQ